MLLRRARHLVVAPGLPSQFRLQAGSSSNNFDLCDLTRFPLQYNPFSCLMVPQRGMGDSPENSEFSSASMSGTDIVLPNS